MTPDEKHDDSMRDEGESTDRVREIIIEMARTELAAITAATAFWGGWVAAADKYAATISEELARVDADPHSTGDLGGRLSDLTREYLRDLAELPTAAVEHFNSQMDKVMPPRRKRSRTARVKD